MEHTQKQVAYLKGLREGLGLDETTREGKLLAALLEAFQAVQEDLAELAAQSQFLEDYTHELDDRLRDVEEFLFEEAGDEQDLYEFLCPSCREVFLVTGDITVDDETLAIVCPHCGHRLAPSEWGPARPRSRQGRQPWASLAGITAPSQEAPSPNGRDEALAENRRPPLQSEGQPAAPRRRTRPPQALDR